MARPRLHVAPPAFAPVAHGLLTTLAGEIRTPDDPHWQLGVTHDPLCAVGGTTYDDCFAVSGVAAPVAAPPPKAATTEIQHRGAAPFTVFNEVDCAVPGFWDNAEALVGEALTQSEQWQVERAFWTGLAGGRVVVMPHLAANTEVVDDVGILLQTAASTVVSGGVPLDVVEALGRLEGALGDCYDGVGVIHAPAVLGAALVDHGLITREGPRYRSPKGHIVVLGSGYAGTSPSGASSAASTWMYATGAVFIYRSAVTVIPVRDSVDRGTNELRALAERTYVIGWDCCHLAVNVSLGGRVTGTPGAAS